MKAPAVEAVFDAVVKRVESLVPSVEASRVFRQTPEGMDVRELPVPASLRQFSLRFLGLEPVRSGVLTPSLTDRIVRVAVDVAYPQLDRGQYLDRRLASDAEIMQRAFGRTASPLGGSIAQVDPTTEREESDVLVILTHTLAVQYRDAER